MTEQEFIQLLNRIDDWFFPRKIGSVDGDWIAIGTYRNDADRSRIEQLLKTTDFDCELQEEGDDVRLTARDRKILLRLPKIPRINLVLFLLTGLTTLLAGALMAGGNPLTNPADLWQGLPFSFTLLMILGFHEFGHYYFARKHRVDATLPYFIPAPTLIGTFGAFIKIKSPIYRRDALLQIGAAGPIAGFMVAVPALVIGLVKSQVVTTTDALVGFVLGDSLLMKLLIALTHPGLAENQDIMLHPIAFAGWIGLLVTMLNLLPIGQLDGGHIAYAILGEKHNRLAWAALLSLLPLSLLSLNWLFWGILILVLMRTAKHPPIMDIGMPLGRRDRLIGFATLVIFILCFTPVPFKG